MTAKKSSAQPKVAASPERQRCNGCEKSKPIESFGRTSKARGRKPMRVCKACITEQAVARRAAESEQTEQAS